MATKKIKPCTLGKRHKWTHQRNGTKTSYNGSTVHFSLRGLYTCECGARKIGDPAV